MTCLDRFFRLQNAASRSNHEVHVTWSAARVMRQRGVSTDWANRWDADANQGCDVGVRLVISRILGRQGESLLDLFLEAATSHLAYITIGEISQTSLLGLLLLDIVLGRSSYRLAGTLVGKKTQYHGCAKSPVDGGFAELPGSGPLGRSLSLRAELICDSVTHMCLPQPRPGCPDVNRNPKWWQLFDIRSDI